MYDKATGFVYNLAYSILHSVMQNVTCIMLYTSVSLMNGDVEMHYAKRGGNKMYPYMCRVYRLSNTARLSNPIGLSWQFCPIRKLS